MDLKTLIISSLVVCLATNLSLGLVYLTRKTYPGFGDWLAGTVCRTLAAILFILPRDSLSPWLTIILPNWLMIVELLLYLRGTRRFYEQRPPSAGWALLATVLYLPVFYHYTYTVPSINDRFLVMSVFSLVLSLAMMRALLTRKPPYAGASEKWQAGLWGLYAAECAFRGGHLLLGGVGPMGDFSGVPPAQGFIVLVISFNSLLIAISQIIMNAQRLEYDHELALARLEQDIIEREKAEAAIRDQERLFSSNFNLSLMGMAITSLEKGWVKVNDRLCQILGYSLEELRSRTWAELTHPDDLAADVMQFNRVLRGEIPGYSMEKRFIRADGQVVPTLMSVACVHAANGQPEFFVAQVHDISQRGSM
ncbi:MAG: PAS domain S-box protein [Methylococcus sp.]